MPDDQNNIDEKYLVRELKKGDSRAFSLFVSKYQSYIIGKCNFYLRNDEEARDISQEILIKVFYQIQNFREEAQLKTWLYSIIHNTCMDFLRKYKKDSLRKFSIVLTDEISDSLEDEIEELNKVKIEPEDLEKLLEELSPEGRLIIILKYKERHSIKDIQKSLGLSESAVKMRISRAKDILRKLIKDKGQTEL